MNKSFLINLFPFKPKIIFLFLIGVSLLTAQKPVDSSPLPTGSRGDKMLQEAMLEFSNMMSPESKAEFKSYEAQYKLPIGGDQSFIEKLVMVNRAKVDSTSRYYIALLTFWNEDGKVGDMKVLSRLPEKEIPAYQIYSNEQLEMLLTGYIWESLGTMGLDGRKK